jgi:hypothetical protein
MQETIRPQDELRLSHVRFISLSKEEGERIAKRHGHTRESFAGLLKKAEAGAKAFEVEKTARYQREALARRKTGKMPPHAVARINAMRATWAQFREARAWETQALKLLDVRGKRDEAVQLMRRAHRVFILHRFAVLSRTKSLRHAYITIGREYFIKMRGSNNPLLQDALDAARSEISAFLDTLRNEEKPWVGSLNVDVTGPGERFSTNYIQGWPGNGRSPHRKNDELEGY